MTQHYRALKADLDYAGLSEPQRIFYLNIADGDKLYSINKAGVETLIGGSGSGVSTVNGNSGPITIIGGNDITISQPAPGTVKIDSTGQEPIQMENAGVPLGTSGTVNELDFVGPGVVASRVGDKVTITVPGGAGQTGVQFQDDGVNQGTSGTVDTVNFTGAGVTASRIGNTLTVDVPSPVATINSAEFFATMPGDNAAPVPIGSDVQFPNDGPNIGVGISRFAADKFQLSTPGVYRVDFQVSVDEPGQLCVPQGAAPIEQANTRYFGRATGTTQIVGMCYVTTTLPNEQISVRNPIGNAAALTITPIAGGAHAVTASLIITRLS